MYKRIYMTPFKRSSETDSVYLICAMPFVYVINFWISEMGEKIKVKGSAPFPL